MGLRPKLKSRIVGLKRRFWKSSEPPKKLKFLDARRNTQHYCIEKTKGWRYADRDFHSRDPLIPMRSRKPHLVLHDSAGTPRFTLRHDKAADGSFRIYSLQRERTRYIGPKSLRFYSPGRETKRSKEFQRQLGGIHPSEFLFSEFLYRNRGKLRAGTKLYMELSDYETDIEIYRPIIARFFKEKPVRIDKETDTYLFELSMEKKRVKEILRSRQEEKKPWSPKPI